MCGIAGIVFHDGRAAGAENVAPAIARLAHRGPDGEDVFSRGPVALGHRRLAIIDPQGGRQPMFNEDGSVAVTFNGEIYNYRELRSELAALGHDFRTKCDAEVLVHGWEQWRRDLVLRLRGMFAFAIVDWRSRELFLARDPFGIKPLVYTASPGRFAFASELQGLRAFPDCPATLDLAALDQYLALLYIPSPRTVFRDVRKLPPAHRLTVGFDGATTGPERYWELAWAPDPAKRSADDWAAELEETLRESVRAHLVSDVPFGAFLSGGMDSTAVVGWMARELPQPVRTFSIGFDEPEYDEAPYARQAADRWRTEHHVERVRPDALAILPALVAHHGEPYGDSSAIPTYYVSRLARQHVPMVLSGDGGDEMLAGYNRYGGWRAWLESAPAPSPAWKRALRPLASRLWPSRFRPRPPRISIPSWMLFVQAMDPELRRRLWRPEHRPLVGRPIDAFEAALSAAPAAPESIGQFLDFRTYLPDDVLAKVDIASMCHGLEVRTPLIDLRVIEFVSRIPPTVSLARDGEGGWESKRLLRRILARDFPPPFIRRPKMGFMVPLDRWFSRGGQLRGALEDSLLAPNAKLLSFFEPDAVRALLAEHDRDGGRAKQLWQLLFLEQWLQSSGAAA